MKKLKILISLFLAATCMATACGATNIDNPNKDMNNKKDKKNLVAYYSRRGMNYVNGNIVNLEVGNTEVVAGKIEALTGSDIFRIETIKIYPEDYNETTEVAQQEKNDNARPALTATIPDMDEYEVIYLGYPIWWGTFPMAVYTFLESYDFTGKTIVPFCTHEGSGLGASIRDIKRALPDSDVMDALALKGSNVSSSDGQIEQWLKKNGMR